MKLKNSKQFWLSDYMIIGYFSLLTLVLHLISIEGFGYFRDEFYYISCSDHLSFGYVDHPPLSVLFLKLIRLILGDSLVAIRIFPVLGGALFVFFTGLMAKELGGGKYAIALASAAGAAVIGNLFLFNYYSMNFLDLLFWQACLLIIIRIIKTQNLKYWFIFGLVAGLGIQNKISVLFLCFGIVVGLLLTPERRYFKNKYLWIGGIIAGLLFLPYILWNIANNWPTLEFMHHAKTYKIAQASPLEFFLGQILYNNPANLFLWLTGLWYFFFHKDGIKYRLFGWMYISIYVLFTIQSAKDYYLAPAYPILFAGGAILVEAWLHKKKWKWPKPVFIISILISVLIFSPAALPILPVEATIKFTRFLGLTQYTQENHEMGVLPQHFADMHGWEEMVEKVAKIYNNLSPQEKNECAIYANNYGVTGAINFFGKKYHLPPAYSGHNNHFFWPPLENTVNIFIIVGGRKEDHENFFNEVIQKDQTDCTYCMPYENKNPIYLCRGIKRPIKEIWPNTKHFN